MRTILIAAGLTALAATPAAAQVVTGGYGTGVQVGHGYPAGGHPGAVYGVPSPGWGGGYVDGRWYAGTRAPGGWNAYRRPQRGWRMPGYWQQPDFRIQNHAAFGLGAPPQGYGWSRYYDDAVLIDDYGQVYDSVSGIDWRRVDQPYATGYGYPSQGYAVAPNGYGGGYGPGYDPNCYPRRRGSGIGGALVGGAIGAGIGVATGGLGTALIAGGAGALAGQAIDRGSRRRYECDYGPQGGGYGYAGDGYAYAQGGQGGVVYAPPQPVVQPLPPEYGYGYQAGYLPGSTATATVEFGGGPITTTTTTTTVTEEYVTEPVAYRKVVRQPVRKWRPAPRRTCYC